MFKLDLCLTPNLRFGHKQKIKVDFNTHHHHQNFLRVSGHSGRPNFFRLNIFWTSHCFWTNTFLGPYIFLSQNSFRHKCFLTHCWPFWILQALRRSSQLASSTSAARLVLYTKMFLTEIFLVPKTFYWSNKFLDRTFFWTQYFFGTQLFFEAKFFQTQNFGP